MGAHATASHGPAVLNVWTCSPVSVWVTSKPEPKRGASKQTSFVQTSSRFRLTFFAPTNDVTAVEREAYS